MKKYGFYIKKLIVSGDGKEDAFLDLKKGLNVVSGASDTGKTYVFEAINYIMGSSDSPKEVEEGEGYEEIFLEIENSNKEILTIKRNLSDGKMYLYTCQYEDIDKNSPSKIIEKHDAKNINNISSFLLNLCNSNYKSVLYNQKGKMESFTFRDFARLTMLNEEEIISKKAILLGNLGPMKYTRNKNAFKTIVTGNEDSFTEIIEEKKISKISLDSKIEILDKFITEYIDDLKKINLEENNYKSDELELIIKSIEDVINNKKQNIEELDESRNELLNEKLNINSKLEYNLEIIKRFKLLRENYLSDLERIEFIGDSNFYFNQLDDVNCPVCNSKIEDYEIISNDKLVVSINAERNKLEKQIKELYSTINILKEKNTALQKRHQEIIENIEQLNLKINIELQPIIDIKINELQNFLNGRDKLKQAGYIESRLLELNKNRKDLVDERGNIKEEKIEGHKLNETNIKDICDIVSNLLEEWKLFDKADIIFDLKNSDLVINGKKKESFGKGYRAILNSAFIIGIMNYTVDRGLPHPKVIVLDSPLTTYKEKDNVEENDKVNDSVKKSFYDYLSKNFNDKQIIILENVDPDLEIKKSIIYHHFSKNKEKGRYGFFPISK